MRIRLAILERDNHYLKRITGVFQMRFADKLEIFAYTEKEPALSELKKNKIDVFLAGEEYEISIGEIPNRCGFAYFVDEPALEEFKGQKTVCKFQQVDMIYKQILNLYAEKFQGIFGGSEEGRTVLWWFGSTGGGCGTSISAASAAAYFAKKQKRILYLELDEFGDAGLFFHGSGQADMKELIFAVKSRKKNIVLKLESCVRRDEKYGVCFFAAPPLALDINELTDEDIAVFLKEIRKSGAYDIVVINRKISMDAFGRCLWREVDRVVLVTDGSETGNSQMCRAYESMKTLSNQAEEYWLQKLAVIYNRYDKNIGRRPEGLEITFIGSIPLYEHATVEQLLQNISLLSLFENLQSLNFTMG